jgi:hypothetical protein
MTLPSRLWALVDALEAHAATGEPLMPEDALAIASALEGEAMALSIMARQRAFKGWRGRTDAYPRVAHVRKAKRLRKETTAMATRLAS